MNGLVLIWLHVSWLDFILFYFILFYFILQSIEGTDKTIEGTDKTIEGIQTTGLRSPKLSPTHYIETGLQTLTKLQHKITTHDQCVPKSTTLQ